MYRVPESHLNPIQTGLFFASCDQGDSEIPAAKITHNNVLIISNFRDKLDWHNDVIWRHYDVILLNLMEEPKFHSK